MELTLTHIREASKMFLRAYTSYRRYNRTPQRACEQIIDNCWNGVFFQTSTGHFTAFYCRDFGMCADALMDLGQKDRVRQTLSWALSIFAHNNKITTTITKDCIPIDCFSYGCDSLPFLLHALWTCGDKELQKKYQGFLEKQSIVYIHTVFDKKSGLVKESGAFSSMKDHYVRQSSTYDNCMVGWLLLTLKKLNYDLPIDLDMRTQLLKHHWAGTHFKDDLYNDVISGDAQVFPFYTGIFDPIRKDKKMWEASFNSIIKEGLDKPFPLKYTAVRDKSKELLIPSLFAPNYEGTAIWIHLGLCYLTVLAKTSPAACIVYLKKYENLILEYQNFLEVFTKDGKPYRSLFYQSDESMIWASIYLQLCKRLEHKE